MARRPATRDDDDDHWDDPDGPIESDTGDDDDDETQVRCPYCRAWKLEDAPRCPACGQYPSAEDAPPARKPTWVLIVLAFALLAAALMAFT